jgi:tripartite-type tricarboxylate transporter receptor subunit TctC
MKALLLAAALVLHACGALAQGYPTRPVTLLVPTTPGTPQDILARRMAPMLAQKLGQPFIVDNRPGASGNIGTAAVVRAAPDGHVLLATAIALTMSPPFYKDMPYNPARDLAPVAGLGKTTHGLAVHASVPATTVAQFLALAKAKPGTLNYGSPGNGTPSHLNMELFKQQVGIDVVHVPYKGQADMIAGLVSGSIDAAFASLGQFLGHVQAGKLRILAVTGDRRSAVVPGVPAFNEANVAEMDTEPWVAVFAPAKTPRELVLLLNREIAAVADQPPVRETLANLGMASFQTTPEALGELVRKDLARWQRVVTGAGIKAD